MKNLRIGTALAALFGLTMFLGCQDEKAATGPHVHVLGRLHVESSEVSLEEGETVELTATPICAGGHALDLPVTWSSADESVATIDDEGVVTGVYEGTAEISAEISAEASGEDRSVSRLIDATVERPGTIVDASGGVITHGSGDVVLEVPDGALAEATKVSIRPSPSDVAAGGPGLLVGTAYHFRPEGQQFRTEARLTVRYRDEGLPDGANESRLRLYHHRDGDWEELDDSRVDTGANTVSGLISGFSHYAVAESGLTPVDSVVVEGSTSGPLMVGETVQLTARLFDAEGNELERRVEWRSNDEAVATVDADGLAVGKGHGEATITASAEGASDAIELRVRGESAYGNNLSHPVIFAEGLGLTGADVTEDEGLRPAPEEEIVVDALPFFWEGNETDYGDFYTQQSPNIWQAEWADGTAADWTREATVTWGDNLTHHTWNTHSMIRVEHVLNAVGAGPMQGFEMIYLYGEGADEMYGTVGTVYDDAVPTVYSVTPRLRVEKLSGTDPAADPGEPVCEIFDGAVHEGLGTDGPGYYSSEVNVAGKVIYGFNFVVRDAVEGCETASHKYGWFRITFSLDDAGVVGGETVQRAVDMVGIDAGDDGETLIYEPQIDPATNATWLEIYIESARGGGGDHDH